MKKEEILAETIVEHSIKVMSNENVLITSETCKPMPLIKELVKKIKKKGANVTVKFLYPEIESLIKEDISKTGIDLIERQNRFDVENYNSFIRIVCTDNDYEGKNVSSTSRKLLGTALKDVNNIRINERKWVLLNYPNELSAYKAHMTTEEFYDYSMNVMCYDYKQMSKDILPLKELMEKTDKVRLTAEGTDIIFSIKDMPIIPCCGEMNIPDGEIYCGPVKNSVNGTIKYNTPSPYQSNVYEDVTLTFKDGKIISCKCRNERDNDKLNEIFNTDEGARYVGEFSIGLNKDIMYPMGDILFDEKIIGSIHFTPGSSYKDSYNGNDSAIHWDMVLIQREDYGGGNIYFDDKLIRENGVFVLDSLKHLNK